MHHSDVGFLAGNLKGIMQNYQLSQHFMDLNFDIIEKFLKGERVEGTLGDKDLGRDFSPKKYHKDDITTW